MHITNDQIKTIIEGTDKTDATAIQQINFMRKATINGLVTGQTSLIPVNNGGSSAVRFIPEHGFVRLRAITGTLSTPAILRIGNSVNFDNIAALTTFTGLSAAHDVMPFILAAQLASVDISSAAISVSVQTAATGIALSVYSLDVYVFGMIE